MKAILKSFSLNKNLTLDIQGPLFYTLKDIIKFTSRLLKKKIIIQETNNSFANIKKINTKESYELLDWQPKISPEKGVRSLINYFLKERI